MKFRIIEERFADGKVSFIPQFKDGLFSSWKALSHGMASAYCGERIFFCSCTKEEAERAIELFKKGLKELQIRHNPKIIIHK